MIQAQRRFLPICLACTVVGLLIIRIHFTRDVSRGVRGQVRDAHSHPTLPPLTSTRVFASTSVMISETDFQTTSSSKPTEKTIPVTNPHEFGYIINNMDICKTDTSLEYVVYVHSAPANFDRRQIFRQTWARKDRFADFTSRLVFFIGATDNQEVQHKLLNESNLYRDIVQEDFKDTYRNLTYKGLAALKWFTNFCRNPTFLIKSDDDTYINIFRLIYLLKTKYLGIHRSIVCNVYDEHTMPVLRDPKTCLKWCVSYKEFKANTYPKYCSGSAFILSSDMAPDMFKTSLSTPFFWIDDVYVTGLLLKKLQNVTFIDESNGWDNDWSSGKEINIAANSTALVAMNVNTKDMANLWQYQLRNQNPEYFKMFKLREWKRYARINTI